MTAAEELHAALLNLIVDKQRPPCADGTNRWTSEDQAERSQASRLCAGCPLLDRCAALADELRTRWGVWGGRDRTPRPRRTK